MGETYRIRVGGHLSDCWSDWLEGMAIECHPDGTTTLTGEIVDQAALHGLIARIRDLALPLVSITRLDPNDDNEPSRTDAKGAPPLEETNRSTVTNQRDAIDGKETK